MIKTLVISEFWPWEIHGGAARVNLVCQSLAELGPVDFLYLPYGSVPGRLADRSLFRAVRVIQQSAEPNPRGIVYGIPHEPMGSRLSLARERIRARLQSQLNGSSYDLAWYVRERTWLLARDSVAAPAVIDVDDLEDMLITRWLALGRNEQGEPLTMAERARMNADIGWWRAVHRQAAAVAEVLVFASAAEQRRVAAGNSLVVPNTYHLAAPADAHSQTAAVPTILFQGSLQWPPNEDAAVWLVKEIAPLIENHIPDLRVILAGDSSPRVEELASQHSVTVTGAVPSMTPYLNEAQLAVVPLRVGGGTRIKILEAFANRVPVVSTSIGAEGLDVRPGVHLEMADSAPELASQCIRLLTSPAARKQMAGNARELYYNCYRPIHARTRIHCAAKLASSSSSRSRSGSSPEPARPDCSNPVR